MSGRRRTAQNERVNRSQLVTTISNENSPPNELKLCASIQPERQHHIVSIRLSAYGELFSMGVPLLIGLIPFFQPGYGNIPQEYYSPCFETESPCSNKGMRGDQPRPRDNVEHCYAGVCQYNGPRGADPCYQCHNKRHSVHRYNEDEHSPAAHVLTCLSRKKKLKAKGRLSP